MVYRWSREVDNFTLEVQFDKMVVSLKKPGGSFYMESPKKKTP